MIVLAWIYISAAALSAILLLALVIYSNAPASRKDLDSSLSGAAETLRAAEEGVISMEAEAGTQMDSIDVQLNRLIAQSLSLGEDLGSMESTARAIGVVTRRMREHIENCKGLLLSKEISDRIAIGGVNYIKVGLPSGVAGTGLSDISPGAVISFLSQELEREREGSVGVLMRGLHAVLRAHFDKLEPIRGAAPNTLLEPYMGTFGRDPWELARALIFSLATEQLWVAPAVSKLLLETRTQSDFLDLLSTACVSL